MRRWLTRNVLALGVVSFLTDISSEMIVSLLPVFLAALGGGAAALGLIEGLADGVAAALKLWAGRRADRTGRRRPLVVAGYALSSLARPLVALAMAPGHVLAVRIVDRVGKGLRSSPRDALLAASVEPGSHGAAFGFNRAMDHAGAVIGPLVAMAVLAWWTSNLRVVFALSAIPAALAVGVVALGVREPRNETVSGKVGHQPGSGEEPTASPAGRAAAASTLRGALLPVMVFALGNASDTFLLLRASQAGIPAVWIPLLWAGLHIVKSASSLPGGWLADRLGPRASLALGWLVFAAACASLAVVEDRALLVTVILACGLHHGLAEPAERVLVARAAPRGRAGEAFGWYHAGRGLAAVASSAGFGAIWQISGHAWAFAAAAAVAGLATGLVVVLVPRPAGTTASRGGHPPGSPSDELPSS